MLGWDLYGFDKKRVGTHSAKLVFLHPVGSVGHVVHSDAWGSEMLIHYFSCSGVTRMDLTRETLR
jgi:hypothetical protein